MPQIAICIEMFYTDLPVLDRIARVAAAGAPGIDMWGWENKDIKAINTLAKQLGVRVTSFGGGGWRPPLVDPASKGVFLDGLAKAIDAAHYLDCPCLIVMSGDELPGVDREQQHRSVVDALKAAARVAEKAKITLVLEPLNTIVDHKGYYLDHAAEGFQMIDEVGSEAVKLLYDVYHMQIMDGTLIQTISENIEKIGHFHAADAPGRYEPGTGELNYANIANAIDDLGYTGYFGLECRQKGSPDDVIRSAVGGFQ
ncbi:MAG: TIM barrel protein [Candidatus Latescibacteria bacterium]|nr:TIM barrel protein [Candidatus Latescibacterota bacterium]